MVIETKKDKVTIKNHFKSRTQEEIDMKVAEILIRLINKELETIR